MIDLNTQVFILIYSFLSGLIFGLCFDIYKILFKIVGRSVLEVIFSFVFWIFVGVSVFYFMLNTQYAVLSFYTYFYVLIGILAYFKVVSKVIFYSLSLVVNTIVFLTRIIFKNIVYIFSKVFS